MPGNLLLDRLRNETVLLWYSLKTLIGRNLLAVAFISGMLVAVVLSYSPGLNQTRESVLLLQLELFAPLLGIVLFSDLIAAEFQAGRAEILRSLAAGFPAVVARKLLHATFFSLASCLGVLVILRSFHTAFDLLPALALALPGVMYFGMLGLLAATASRRPLAGYAVGTIALVLSLVVEQLELLGVTSYSRRRFVPDHMLLGEDNWLVAKIYYLVASGIIAWIVLRMARRPDRVVRQVVTVAALIIASYTAAYVISEPPPESPPIFVQPGRVLEIRETGDTLVVRKASTMRVRVDGQDHDETTVEDIRYRRQQDAWTRDEAVPHDTTREVDLIHVNVDVDLSPASATFTGTARAELQVKAEKLDRGLLRIAAEFQIDRVEVDGHDVEFEAYGDLLVIPLPDRASRGDSLSISVGYRGGLRLPSAHHRSENFDRDYLFVGSRWYPNTKSWYHQGPMDLFTYHATVRVPAAYRVAAGRVVATEAGKTSYVLESELPVREIPLVVGQFQQFLSKYRDIPISVNAFSITELYAREILDRCADVLRVFEEAFGPYPYPHLAVVEDRFQSGGGVGVPSIVKMKVERWRPDHRRHFLDAYMPHEISHMWWDTGFSSWIAEGAAVFSNFHFLEKTRGRAVATSLLDDTIYESFVDGPKRIGPLPGDYAGAQYALGGYLLIMLQEQCREERLLETLREFHADRRGRQIVDHDETAERFVQSLRQLAGDDLGQFVTDWVQSVKTFDPALTALYQQQVDGEFRATLRLRHQGEIRFPVSLRVTLKDGSHVDAVWKATAHEESMEFTLDHAAVSATLDPEHVLLDFDRSNNRAFATPPPAVAPTPSTDRHRGWKTYTTTDGLLSGDVRCLVVDSRGQVLAGLRALGKTTRWAVSWLDESWQTPDHEGDERSFQSVYAIARAADGTLWTGGHGRLRRSRDDEITDLGLGEFRRFGHGSLGSGHLEPNSKSNSKILGSVVRALLADREDRLWVGTDHGASVLDPGTTEWRVFSRRHGLPGREVLALIEDASGVIWAGTERGLAVHREGTWSRHPACGSDVVLCAAADGDGRLCFGTFRSGLVIVRGQDVTTHTADNSALPHNAVSAVAIDDRGRLWAATPEGLCSLDGASWRVYTEENSGLPSHDIRALATGDEGSLWIGTEVGVTRFRIDTAD